LAGHAGSGRHGRAPDERRDRRRHGDASGGPEDERLEQAPEGGDAPAAFASILGLDAGTVRHDRRGRVAMLVNLTVSLHARNGPLTAPVYRRSRGDEASVMRLIVTLTAALTVLFLVLPAHP